MIPNDTNEASDSLFLNAEKLVIIRALALITASIGVAVLYGWAFDVLTFKTLLPGLGSMKANTAVALSLSGTSLYLLTIKESRYMTRLSWVFAIASALIGVATFSEYVFKWNIGIDQLLFVDIATKRTPPGRMSAITAVSIIVINALVIGLSLRKYRGFLQVGSLFCLFTLALPVIGLMFGGLSFPRIGTTTQVAPHTAAGLLMLAAAVLIATDQHGILAKMRQKKIPILFLFGISFILICTVATFYSDYKSSRAYAELSRAYQVIEFSNRLRALLYQYRDATQYYLQTKDKKTIEKAESLKANVFDKLQEIHILLIDNISQQKDLLQFNLLLKDRFKTTDDLIATRNGIQHISEEQLEAVLLTNTEAHDALIRQLDEFTVTEEETLSNLREAAQRKDSISTLSIGITMLLTFILLAVNTYILRKQSIKNLLYQKELENLSRADALTGLFNRRYFLELAKQEIAREIRHNRTLSVLMIDIDHFKKINDTYGHAAGDEALRKMSQVLCNSLREFDIYCRLGGEEFAAVLPETSKEQATEIAERLRLSIENSSVFVRDGITFRFTVSIGVSHLIHPTDKIEALLDQADQALYEAKQSGRNRVCIAS